MRQQQDEPGRFSICSRQAAVVHHAVCDGFHVGRMLNELQQYCDEWQGGA
ncbi:hypothetical protein J9N83_003673 [Salmonella enterica]|nr:hypothetical protein [Salmonella enterica]